MKAPFIFNLVINAMKKPDGGQQQVGFEYGHLEAYQTGWRLKSAPLMLQIPADYILMHMHLVNDGRVQFR